MWLVVRDLNFMANSKLGENSAKKLQNTSKKAAIFHSIREPLRRSQRVRVKQKISNKSCEAFEKRRCSRGISLSAIESSWKLT